MAEGENKALRKFLGKRADKMAKSKQIRDFHPEYSNAPADFVAMIKVSVGQCMFVQTKGWPARHRKPHAIFPELVYPNQRFPTKFGGTVRYAVNGAYCYFEWKR